MKTRILDPTEHVDMRCKNCRRECSTIFVVEHAGKRAHVCARCLRAVLRTYPDAWEGEFIRQEDFA